MESYTGHINICTDYNTNMYIEGQLKFHESDIGLAIMSPLTNLHHGFEGAAVSTTFHNVYSSD